MLLGNPLALVHRLTFEDGQRTPRQRAHPREEDNRGGRGCRSRTMLAQSAIVAVVLCFAVGHARAITPDEAAEVLERVEQLSKEGSCSRRKYAPPTVVKCFATVLSGPLGFISFRS